MLKPRTILLRLRYSGVDLGVEAHILASTEARMSRRRIILRGPRLHESVAGVFIDPK